MGVAKAMGTALFGDKISGRPAADWGMIYEAVPLSGADSHIARRAQHFADGDLSAPENCNLGVVRALAGRATGA